MRRDLEEDPRILYYTSYGRDLRVEDRDEAYPWNAIDVVTDSIAAVVTPGNLREADRAYYKYVGSFTTPPCTEGVLWMVLRSPVALSEAQIARFRAIIHGNNRPVQPLNGRSIVTQPK